jgi:membrane fusion protein, multidrug efflux system
MEDIMKFCKGKRTVPFILIIIFLVSCSRGGTREDVSETGENPLSVEGVTLTKGVLIEEVSISGVIEGGREASVVSETEGVIQNVSVTLGDRVAEGDLLVQVDDTVARLNMEQTRQQLETARIDLRTKEELLRSGGVSRADLARSQSAAAGAEARYRSAVKVFEDCSIVSPFDGYIALIGQGISKGNYLGRGSVVVRVVDLDTLKLKAGVGEQLISLVRRGSGAKILVPAACGDQLMEGRVSAVAAGSDPSTGSFIVEVEWENRCGESARSGMSASAVIEPAGQEPRLLVPTASIIRRGGTTAVFMIDNGIARLVSVETGDSLGNRTVVASGLNEGDTVLLTGIGALSDGDRVSVSLTGESGDWR